MPRRRMSQNKETLPSTEPDLLDFKEGVNDFLDRGAKIAVSFVKQNDGTVSVITTDGDPVEVIGLIDVGKQLVFDDRWRNNNDE
ncbi:hypothetical protein ACFSMW_06650 [Virgibacillus halophilus]|uniref:Uncharacterized protein n=1 Tax=Tigheibacillus halophilus TaxID=361280 RepID=A0ABU5C6T8_9BACI|nr:hypothetical protein [Virgibacillus halophilus]